MPAPPPQSQDCGHPSLTYIKAVVKERREVRVKKERREYLMVPSAFYPVSCVVLLIVCISAAHTPQLLQPGESTPPPSEGRKVVFTCRAHDCTGIHGEHLNAEKPKEGRNTHTLKTTDNATMPSECMTSLHRVNVIIKLQR